MAQIIQIRRDTAANWTATNPILAHGEIGVEQEIGATTSTFKVGNGTDNWNTLGYSGGGSPSPTPSLSGYTLLVTTAALTGNLQAQISLLPTFANVADSSANSLAQSYVISCSTSANALAQANSFTLTQLLNYITSSDVASLTGQLALDSNTVHRSGVEEISGEKTFVSNMFLGSNLTVAGDLSVAGSSFVVRAQQVSASDNIIMINAGETGSGVTNISAGIVVDRGTSPDYYFVFDEIDDSFRIGQAESLQPVATREEVPVHGGIAQWNSGSYRFETSSGLTSGTISSISSNVSAISGELQNILAKTGEPQGFENRTDSSLAWFDSTLTFRITGNYYVWIKGKRIPKTGETQVISNTVGSHFFYYDENGVFTYSMTVWDILKHVPIAFVRWDGTTGILFEERHGIIMDRVTHHNLHMTRGTQVSATGFVMNGYQLNTDTLAGVKYGISSGTIYDEDLETVATPLVSGGTYTIWTKTGAGQIDIIPTQSLPFLTDGTNIQYNQLSGSTWVNSPLTSNGQYVNYYVFTMPAVSGTYQFAIIPGQATYSTLALAQAETIASLNLTGIFTQEYSLLYQITYERLNAYSTTTGRAAVKAVTKIVNNNTLINAAAAQSQHNSLLGLQGGTAGQYFHLTSAQASDFVGSSQVVHISGNESISGNKTFYGQLSNPTIEGGLAATRGERYGYASGLNISPAGIGNVVFGNSALYSCNAGQNNVAIGSGTLYACTSGSNNMGVGWSLQAITTGNSNVAVGQGALSSCITGSNNVAIGRSAGFNELGSGKLYINCSGSVDSSATAILYGENDSQRLFTFGKQLATVNDISGFQPSLLPFNSQATSAYTLVITDAGKTVSMNYSTANTLTVPLSSSVAFDIGTQIIVVQEGAGQTTVSPATSGVTIYSRIGKKIAGQYGGITLIKRSSNEWLMIGDTSA